MAGKSLGSMTMSQLHGVPDGGDPAGQPPMLPDGAKTTDPEYQSRPLPGMTPPAGPEPLSTEAQAQLDEYNGMTPEARQAKYAKQDADLAEARSQGRKSPFGAPDNGSVIAPNPGHSYSVGKRMGPKDEPVTKEGTFQNSSGSTPVMPISRSYDAAADVTRSQPTTPEGSAELSTLYGEEKQGRRQFEDLTHNSASLPDGGEKEYDQGMQDAIARKQMPEPKKRRGVN